MIVMLKLVQQCCKCLQRPRRKILFLKLGRFTTLKESEKSLNSKFLLLNVKFSGFVIEKFYSLASKEFTNNLKNNTDALAIIIINGVH